MRRSPERRPAQRKRVIVTEPKAPKSFAGAHAPATGVWGSSDDSKLEYLLTHVALVYGTPLVFDNDAGVTMKQAHLVHAYGAKLVDLWRESPRRLTLRPEDVPLAGKKHGG